MYIICTNGFPKVRVTRWEVRNIRVAEDHGPAGLNLEGLRSMTIERGFMEVRFRLEFERQVVEPCNAFKPFIPRKSYARNIFFDKPPKTYLFNWDILLFTNFIPLLQVWYHYDLPDSSLFPTFLQSQYVRPLLSLRDLTYTKPSRNNLTLFTITGCLLIFIHLKFLLY